MRNLHPLFAAEAGGVDLREVHDEGLVARTRIAMHRATAFDDSRHRRESHRVTTLDIN